MRNPILKMPSSKSVAARLLTIGFLSGRDCNLHNLPDCDDTRDLYAAFHLLAGYAACRNSENEKPLHVDLGSGAASYRFFIAAAASLEGVECVVECSPQLMKRPVAPLLDALLEVGAELNRDDATGNIHIRGKRLSGTRLRVATDVSSQFLSALMLASALWEGDTTFVFEKRKSVSWPYVEMTIRLMRLCGAEIEFEECRKGDDSESEESSIIVKGCGYAMKDDMEIEGDWSAASYFYLYSFLHPGESLRLEHLSVPEESVQGDAACCKLFKRLGVDTEIVAGNEFSEPEMAVSEDKDRISTPALLLNADARRIKEIRESGEMIGFNLNGEPDLVPALAVALSFGAVPFRIDGIAHLKYKESNRLEALKTELSKFGFNIDIGEGYISGDGDRGDYEGRRISVATYSDHRIAMAFGAACCGMENVMIENPDVVEKSFPGFWIELDKLREHRKRIVALEKRL